MGNHTVALLLHGDLETKSGFLLLIKKNSHRADFIWNTATRKIKGYTGSFQSK